MTKNYIFTIMKHFTVAISLFTAILLGSCGSESSYYSDEQAMMEVWKKIEEQFPGNPQFQMISLIYEPTLGNILTVIIKPQAESRMTETWIYRNTPIKTNKRGMRINFGSFSSWEKTSEQFEEENTLSYFRIDQIPPQQIPLWIEDARARMKAKGATDPEVGSFFIMNSVDGLSAYVEMQTMGGGSKVGYTYRLDGTLIRES